jgi:phage baseplate assembly protein W|tara:strand:- start:2805 stop:3173 length:369 start_codon:yes stop_codon:yes gene_type:complete
MSSLAVGLPLELGSVSGFKMITTIKGLFKQNLKMLILTIPGERVMEPRFGVGLKTYLFENFGQDAMAQIDNKIREQVRIYMPALKIQNIVFGNTDPDNNYLGIQITYSIPNIAATDLLELTT